LLPIHHHRRRRNSALALSSALLLTTSAPIFGAQTEGSEQRRQLEHLRDVNADARRDAERSRNEVEEMQAEVTDRGLLLTLDDAMFAPSDAGLSSSGHYRLGALVGFLERYPERTVAIDGYAGAGGYRYDLSLVKRRADSVRAYLIREGVSSSRLTKRGSGVAPQVEDFDPREPPRRRVEAIIEDRSTSAPRPGATTPGTPSLSEGR
jgi:outer membrane protein OmpA-like peptidoglycan-associated protein